MKTTEERINDFLGLELPGIEGVEHVERASLDDGCYIPDSPGLFLVVGTAHLPFMTQDAFRPLQPGFNIPRAVLKMEYFPIYVADGFPNKEDAKTRALCILRHAVKSTGTDLMLYYAPIVSYDGTARRGNPGLLVAGLKSTTEPVQGHVITGSAKSLTNLQEGK